jgi:hypothetical protein
MMRVRSSEAGGTPLIRFGDNVQDFVRGVSHRNSCN